MRNIIMIGLVLIALLAATNIAYSTCWGPPYDCTTCPTCGSIGQVFHGIAELGKAKEIGEKEVRATRKAVNTIFEIME